MIAIGLLILLLITIAVGYLLLNPWLFGICQPSLYCLDNSVGPALATPLYWGTHWLLPLSIVLIFVRREVFNSWWKVALPLGILSLILILISPPIHGFIDEPDRTTVTEMMVWIIDVVSTIVILWKYWRLSRTPKVKPAQIG